MYLRRERSSRTRHRAAVGAKQEGLALPLLPVVLLAAATLACSLGDLTGNRGGATATPETVGLLQTQLALDQAVTSLAQTQEVLANPPTTVPATLAPPPTAITLPTAAPLSATATRPPVAAGSDDYEPDDTPEQASVIAPNGDPQAHNFGKANDEDWIVFDGVKGTRYSIKTLDLGAESDTFIELFDSGGTSLGYDDDGAGVVFGPSLLIFNCGSDGRYFIKVRNYFRSGVGRQATYSLQITER